MLLADHDEPLRLRLSAEADRQMLDLERRLEPRLAPHADLAHIVDWASKLNGAIARLAGLLYVAEVLPTSWGQQVPGRYLDAGARLGHYFLGHALAVFDQMGADPTIDAANAVLDWISRTGAERFTRRDAFTGLSRARFRKVTDLEAPLTLLEAHGYLRRAAPAAPTGGRPSSPAWEVHPCAAKAAKAAEDRP